jgi:uncharacterized membrane protein
MNPRELSRQHREQEGGFLKERRGTVTLALTAAGCMGLIALYQMGVIRHLPDLPFSSFNADKVDASDEAYSKLQMGDAFIGLGSYAVTAGLAAMGGKDRDREQPWIPLALAAKAAADAGTAAKLTYDQWAQHRAFCIWCLIAAGATFAAAALVIPEARSAVNQLRNTRPKHHRALQWM